MLKIQLFSFLRVYPIGEAQNPDIIESCQANSEANNQKDFKMSDVSYIMTLVGNRPTGWYSWKNDGGTPPWAFSGYALMNASTTEEATSEYKREEDAYWDAQ